jgi:hypothetical protein
VMTALFPEPAASSMDELLARQKAAAGMMPGKRPKKARA